MGDTGGIAQPQGKTLNLRRSRYSSAGRLTLRVSEGVMAPTSFLDLPCEIRRQIYHVVYLSHAVPQQKVAPFISMPPYVVRAVGAAPPGAEPLGQKATRPRKPRLLSSGRHRCYIPASLLQSCQQVYHEARSVPFHHNEFQFVNWWMLGLKTALSFSEGLMQWQRAELRYVKLELYAEHISREDLHSQEWVKLCGLWEGLRGLRLLLNMEGHGSYSRGQQAEKKARRDVWELVGGHTAWIRLGLGRLVELQQLEVEIAEDRLTDQEKVRWCRLLQDELCVFGGRSDVLVTCIERIHTLGYLP